MAESPVQLAKMIGINHASVFRWRAGTKPVPWKWLRQLVHKQRVSWDWILDGKEPKELPNYATDFPEDYDWTGINKRFLSLFLSKTQIEIAKKVGVSQTTVSKWERNEKHVPWEKLEFATKTFIVTWNWILDGK